jgi:glycosyltransferase involved in cell wall biosynthesis
VAPHKGINLILDAAATLVARGQTGFRVDVFGAGEVTELLVQIAARGLDRQVRYLGCPDKDELMTQLAGYDALLFPTWPREPFGFVVAEAAAAGCVPVMTAGIGAAEWFLSDVDSLKIGHDAGSLVGAMYKLIMMPSSELRVMRARARTTASRFFGFDARLQTVESILAAAEPAAGGPAVTEARRMDSAMGILCDLFRSEHHG